MIPLKTYHTVLHLGLTGHDVYALQLNLSNFSIDVATDGIFGKDTQAAVKFYQTKYKLAAIDGIAGTLTQRDMARRLIAPPVQANNVPVGLLEGIVEGESAWAVGAVNWQVVGGVDCGWVQRRVYTKAFTDANFKIAFDGKLQFAKVAKQLRDIHDIFDQKPNITSKRAWQLAVLDHNWPYAAQQLSLGHSLSNSPADWVINIGVHGITTPAQWADYYILTKTIYVTEWT